MVAGVIGQSGAGATLNALTDVDERYCWRYAADTMPKATFLAILLRSERGGAVLSYIMDGCTAHWWLEYLDLERKAAQLAQVRALLADH